MYVFTQGLKYCRPQFQWYQLAYATRTKSIHCLKIDLSGMLSIMLSIMLRDSLYHLNPFSQKNEYPLHLLEMYGHRFGLLPCVQQWPITGATFRIVISLFRYSVLTLYNSLKKCHCLILSFIIFSCCVASPWPRKSTCIIPAHPT